MRAQMVLIVYLYTLYHYIYFYTVQCSLLISLKFFFFVFSGGGAITKFILRYGRTSDTLGGYNKLTKGGYILMTFFYYKLHMELSKNNKHEELILR